MLRGNRGRHHPRALPQNRFVAGPGERRNHLWNEYQHRLRLKRSLPALSVNPIKGFQPPGDDLKSRLRSLVFSSSSAESKIALLSQAARLRKQLDAGTALCQRLSVELSRSIEESAELPKNSPLLKIMRGHQAAIRKQIKASMLDIKRNKKLIELIAKSV